MTVSIGLRFGPAGDLAETPPPPELEGLAAELPTVAFTITSEEAPGADLCLDAQGWCAGEVDLYAFDARVDQLAAGGLVSLRVISDRGFPAERLVDAAGEVLTRCQRWMGRRNASSCGSGFDTILAMHRRLHDLRKPLVRADYHHALDVWQWMLRLQPEAGAAAQIAALFHDIERLASEADARSEHQAESYDDFKRAHAWSGAQMTCDLLGALRIDDALRARVTYLIARHDRPGRPGPGKRDEDARLLANADGLSFFSLNSAGYLDYYGREHTRRKIAWTLARMDAEAQARLARVRLRPDVASLMPGADAQARVPAPPPPAGTEEETP